MQTVHSPAILNYIRANPLCSISDVQVSLGLRLAETRGAIIALKRSGLIAAVTSNSRAHQWYVVGEYTPPSRGMAEHDRARKYVEFGKTGFDDGTPRVYTPLDQKPVTVVMTANGQAMPLTEYGRMLADMERSNGEYAGPVRWGKRARRKRPRAMAR